MKKADNFDASKWLVENKITTQSRLNEGIVSAPLSNFLWKLNPKVKEWENISSTKEALSFIKSLTNEELNNLYVWRLGFDIPQSEDEKIKNLLDLIDNKIGESKLNEAEEDEMDMEVKTILDNNGIDDDYFESMGEKSIETGTEEWLDILSDVTGKDAETAKFDKNDEAKIQAFMQKLKASGIKLI